MSRLSCAVLGCVAVSTLTIGAQTQPETPTTAAGAAITVVGCVQNAVADGSVAGTPLGTSATPGNAGAVANAQPPIDGYLLTGARPADAAVGTSGGSAAAPGSGNTSKETLKTYALEGNRDELAAHKGHRVEISGTLAPPVSSGANAPANREFQTGVQRLRVQAIKMTAESCQEK